MSKIRILLGRHPESEGNLDENQYKKGDGKVMPTALGWKQSLHMGKFLGQYYQDTENWPTIYLSDYNRVLGGFNGALEGGLKAAFNNTEPQLKTDPRLVEKFFGALTELLHPEDNDNHELFQALADLSERVFKRDRFTASNLFGESSLETQVRVKSHIDGSLARDIQEGQTDFLIYAHGAIVKAFIAAWFHIPQSQFHLLETPGNCDIIEITGEPKNWSIRKIYDGEKMEEANKPIIDHIERLTVKNLPEVPADILAKFHQELEI